MKRLLIIICLIPLWVFSQSSESFRADFEHESAEFSAHTNILPITIGEWSFGVSYIKNKHFSYLLELGNASAPKYGTLYRVNREEPFDAGRGCFLKLGADYYLKILNYSSSQENKLINPFIGARIIVSRVHERYFENLWDSTFDNVYSMNYGAAVVIGNQTKLYKRLSIRLGLQLGKDMIQNRKYQKFGYTPGLGIYWNSFRTQLLGEINYVLIKRT